MSLFVELEGNVEPRCGKLVTLNPVIYADSLRLVPLTWYRSPGLRFEILGCKDGCDISLGLIDNSIKDVAITASGTLDSNIPPNNVRMQPLGIQVSPTLGWRPASRNNEWIQVSVFPFNMF
ncbi:Venom prothrombin activator oscutarin-C non-catalytic subunit [Holothuria leucospilota]|uniref:Venom prothrombin activator oscutarin-C non-catalytic subunit n=1 Tax=Holothuria leucospilota TaxID=206669 RepID=A0A9Q0YTH7_HOLLE|nr:Venom prothrombin activator oscutarin-C non-catalytic subunit [Holothuria leucospilota]